MKIFIVALSLAFVSSVVLTTSASADRMNGKGNCAGGVCTGGGSLWNSAPPKAKKPAQGAASKQMK